jgi:hypothetical protein
MVETNVFLDEVAVMVTDFLEHHGFALLAPAGARFRLAENGSSGVEIVVRLEDPGDVDAAKAALVERFPDRLSEVIVS